MKPDLSTRYLGFELASPIVASASPVTGDLATLVRLQEAGVGAVVLPSLFEEQIEQEELAFTRLHEFGTETFAEALDYLPELDSYNTGPERYLRSVEEAKSALSIPVIASLNGASPGGWVRYAKSIEDAGADALELNVHQVPTDPRTSGAEVEAAALELVAAVRAAIRIPLAVKVAHRFSAFAHFGLQLVESGADGLVLFNRYLRPDLDLDEMRLVPSLSLSAP
ncbi:MAG: dihydroorotate dehydrogenase-like protein, partial [Planctomycetota bacterium]